MDTGETLGVGDVLILAEEARMAGAWRAPAMDDARAASTPPVNRRMRREGKLGLRRCALVAQVYSGLFVFFSKFLYLLHHCFLFKCYS